MQKSKILFIGLGTMGSHMASHIQKSKKYDLYVYNRTAKIKNKWILGWNGQPGKRGIPFLVEDPASKNMGNTWSWVH